MLQFNSNTNSQRTAAPTQIRIADAFLDTPPLPPSTLMYAHMTERDHYHHPNQAKAPKVATATWIDLNGGDETMGTTRRQIVATLEAVPVIGAVRLLGPQVMKVGRVISDIDGTIQGGKKKFEQLARVSPTGQKTIVQPIHSKAMMSGIAATTIVVVMMAVMAVMVAMIMAVMMAMMMATIGVRRPVRCYLQWTRKTIRSRMPQHLFLLMIGLPKSGQSLGISRTTNPMMHQYLLVSIIGLLKSGQFPGISRMINL
jgi:hypothetical protein